MKNEILQKVIPTYGFISSIAEQLLDSNKNSREILQTNDDEKINNEIKRKKAETQILELEAKVAQELAISKRIESAEIVEIEEYYEGFGKGNVGVNAEEGIVKVGLSGEGKKVTKRIYRFTGFKVE